MLPGSASSRPRRNTSTAPPRLISSPRPTTANLNNGSNTSAYFPPQKPLSHSKVDAEKLDAYLNKYDISRNFLESVEHLTRQEFERATMEDAMQKVANLLNNNHVNSAPTPPRTVSRKMGGIDGYRFFGPPTSSDARPQTVPNTLAKKPLEKPRPGTAVPVGPRALTKTKISPAPSRPLVVHTLKSSVTSDLNSNTPSDTERPDSAASSRRVTFAADVVNYERENKPSKKRKMPKRRKQGFPHPSRGIFVPPEWEIVECAGPALPCKNNPYLNFTQVWTLPAVRNIGENNTDLVIRKERFHRVMTDLEHAHHHYNRLSQQDQDIYLIHCIFKRYVIALDLALTEANTPQIEHLLETIENSSKVLQRSMHSVFFDATGVPKEVPLSDRIEHPDLILVNYALNRISGDQPRHNVDAFSVETILVKLCLEMVALVFSPVTTRLFRLSLAALPFTAQGCSQLLKQHLSEKDTLCYIRWINNSTVQRDFRSILKNFELLDKHGCKSDIPDADLPSLKQKLSTKPGVKRVRVPSAPGIRRPRSSS